MKTDTPLLPDGVAESWFHVHAGGEVWTSRVCRGADLLNVLDELVGTDERDAEHLANADNWYVLDGKCRSISIACGEDPDIEITMIEDRGFAALAEHYTQLRNLLTGFVRLTNNEGKDGWRVTLEYDNYHDGARVIDADGKVIAECYDSMSDDGEECGDRQCIEAMRRAVCGIKPGDCELDELRPYGTAETAGTCGHTGSASIIRKP